MIVMEAVDGVIQCKKDGGLSTMVDHNVKVGRDGVAGMPEMDVNRGARSHDSGQVFGWSIAEGIYWGKKGGMKRRRIGI